MTQSRDIGTDNVFYQRIAKYLRDKLFSQKSKTVRNMTAIDRFTKNAVKSKQHGTNANKPLPCCQIMRTGVLINYNPIDYTR